MSVTKFYGAPGTGKTRALIGEFKAAIFSGIPAENILCTQFRSEAVFKAQRLKANRDSFKATEHTELKGAMLDFKNALI